MEETPVAYPPSGASLQDLQAVLGYQFADATLLERALTHRSFVHQHSDSPKPHNEALEFLGDAILGFCVSEELYRCNPAAAEGALSKAKAYLVSASNLQRLAREMHLGEYLHLSFGEEKTGGRRKRALLVDAFEALIAAVFLDGGIEAARRFIRMRMGAILFNLDVNRVGDRDHKSTLQEQLHHLRLPEAIYEVIEETGPDHAKLFTVELRIGSQYSAKAAGKTKKEAQQNAARAVLEQLTEGSAEPQD